MSDWNSNSMLVSYDSIIQTRTIQLLHSQGFLHRDIKLDNVLLKDKDQSTSKVLILIDYGLATKYLDDCGTHLPEEDEDAFMGNQIFASRRAM